jgi:hypothetical protein
LFKHAILLTIAALSIAAATTADAKPKHHKRNAHAVIVCNRLGCSDWAEATDADVRQADMQQVIDANGNDVVGRRPEGCPHAFCGCEASRYIFGEIRPELNVAANWIRKFPRTQPAPGMVAARQHHVMVLMSHVEGRKWMVHDGNSGGGLTRDHVESISGYVIVDPHGSRSAEN